MSLKSSNVSFTKGWHGLAMARTYIQVNPSHSVVLLEAQSSIGGVWSKDRVYADFKSNNLLGTFEFSDFAMDSKTYGVQPGQHIPGETVHRYLNDFATKFGILRRVRFSTLVKQRSKCPMIRG
jgi:cation diffusion facilitator CzcD-associated flavoprotein CzcO